METAPAPRPAFLTWLARTAVVCSLLGIVAGGFQCVLPSILLSSEGFRELAPAGSGPAAGALGPGLRWIGLGSVLASLTAFCTALGLLRRRPWARISFMALLGLGIAANIASVFVIRSAFSALPRIPEGYVFPHFRLFMGILEGGIYAGLLAATVLMGWLVRRLCSPDVRAEFQRNGSAGNGTSGRAVPLESPKGPISL